LLALHEVMVAYNPRSNASNGLVPLDLAAFQLAGITVGLSGDGFTLDMRHELPLAALLQRQGHHTPRAMPPDSAIDLGIGGNAAIISRLTNWKLGALSPGCLADLVLYGGLSSVPLTAQNALWHLANGLPGLHVRDVCIGGRPVLSDGAPTTVDAERIISDMRRVNLEKWKKIPALH
jgi:5-methylthioadenosine/S-adenosylhomocysteine deaminase